MPQRGGATFFSKVQTTILGDRRTLCQVDRVDEAWILLREEHLNMRQAGTGARLRRKEDGRTDGAGKSGPMVVVLRRPTGVGCCFYLIRLTTTVSSSSSTFMRHPALVS
jgi:hypothetical protein